MDSSLFFFPFGVVSFVPALSCIVSMFFAGSVQFSIVKFVLFRAARPRTLAYVGIYITSPSVYIKRCACGARSRCAKVVSSPSSATSVRRH